MRGSLVILIHAAISLTVIIAATILAAMGDIDSQAVVAVYGAGIGLAGGIGGAIAVNGGAKQTTAAAEAVAKQTIDAAEATATRTVEAAQVTAERTTKN